MHWGVLCLFMPILTHNLVWVCMKFVLECPTPPASPCSLLFFSWHKQASLSRSTYTFPYTYELSTSQIIKYYVLFRIRVAQKQCLNFILYNITCECSWTVKNPIGHFKWEVLSNSAMFLKVVKTVHGYLLLFHWLNYTCSINNEYLPILCFSLLLLLSIYQSNKLPFRQMKC